VPVLVWLLLERRWRSVGWALAAAVVPFALGLLWTGSGPYREWLSALVAPDPPFNPLNASWPGFVARVAPKSAVPVLQWTGVFVTCLIAARALPTRPVNDRLLGVLLIAFFISPIGWVHYLVMAAGPLTVWLSEGNPWPRGAWLLWLHPLIAEWSAHAVPALLLPSFYTYGLFALWLAVLRPNGGAERASVIART